MNLDEKEIHIRDLNKKLPQLEEATRRGESFIVVKDAQKLFRITPIDAGGDGKTSGTFKLPQLRKIRVPKTGPKKSKWD